MVKFKHLITFCFLLFPILILAQDFYRIQADFSIKETLPQGKTRLIMGKVYYDKNYRKILYDVSFPAQEKIVVTDSFLIRITMGKTEEKASASSTCEFSVFHLCLSSRFSDFGLKNSPYKIEKVEKDSGMVITTYLPPLKYSGKLGKVMLSQKEKKLFGMVLFSPQDEVSGKQFFKKYANVKGLEFPLEIVQISYSGGEELYKVTTFRNIAVNEMSEENFYNFQWNK